MPDNTQSHAAKTPPPATSMGGETQQRWGKFSAPGALKKKDELLAEAQRHVDAFAKGRQIVANQAARYQLWRRR